MNEQRKPLSGEQALDDYFADLLAEGNENALDKRDGDAEQNDEEGAAQIEDETGSVGSEQELPLQQVEVESPKQDVVPTPEVDILEHQDSLQYQPKTSFVQPDSYAQRESDLVPNLEDVERLLGQLQVMNHSSLEDIDDLIERNTVEIKLERQESVSTAASLADNDIDDPAAALDEIQDWETDSLDTHDVVIDEQVVESSFSESTFEPTNESVSTIETEHDVHASSMQHAAPQSQWQSTQRDTDFQVLYFEVNQVTFAVPLDELGGIHQLGELNHLIGRPKWYLGLQTSKAQQLDVVDTAKWVMADKLADESYKDGYQYIVMLGESMWGLAASQLLGTELLKTEQINWRSQAGKRPWLAGMVKEKMCALIHVEELIAMLKAGLDVKSLN
ncbi:MULTISPECIES: chemotaxis protein CheW [unclassified Vibrio]|uniref:Chemotaxis protein CheW n=1 Tax=Vibrio sp. HB236076 TaxID=3232307 RepID=A0AB39HGR4_9VIBR|nr:chemotaxis protein CheW [Vibrio sp. HB161653]MDP5254777.1 chemotaxis protein CheW [Vibrio sp. HB161653]